MGRASTPPDLADAVGLNATVPLRATSSVDSHPRSGAEPHATRLPTRDWVREPHHAPCPHVLLPAPAAPCCMATPPLPGKPAGTYRAAGRTPSRTSTSATQPSRNARRVGQRTSTKPCSATTPARATSGSASRPVIRAATNWVEQTRYSTPADRAGPTPGPWPAADPGESKPPAGAGPALPPGYRSPSQGSPLSGSFGLTSQDAER